VAELCAALFNSTLDSLAAAKAWSSYLTDISIALKRALIPDTPVDQLKSRPALQPLLPKSISVPSPFPPRRDVEPLFSYPEPLFQAQFSKGVRDLALSLLICRATCVVVLESTSLEVLQLLADLSAAFVSSFRSRRALGETCCVQMALFWALQSLSGGTRSWLSVRDPLYGMRYVVFSPLAHHSSSCGEPLQHLSWQNPDRRKLCLCTFTRS
jgi:hypothetical protein